MNYTKNEVILQVENVSLRYDRLILRDVNFMIHDIIRPGMAQGQVISLIGRSGIGKTQLFKILSGINKPTSGIVKIGKDLHPVVAGEVGIVPQNYILFAHRTILDNLKIAIKNNNEIPDKDKDKVIKEYASNFDLKEHLGKYPMQLSGGQRQRVSIIQQVLTGNKFILFDEPFSGLDALMIDKVIELILKVSTLQEMNTLIIVSHDIQNSLAVSDTAFILANQGDKEGATITETLDLIEMDFAWHEEIKKDNKFQQLVSQIKYKI